MSKPNKRVDLASFIRKRHPGPVCSVCKLAGISDYIAERAAEAQKLGIVTQLTGTALSGLVLEDLGYEVSADRLRRHVRRCQPAIWAAIQGG